MGGDEFPPWRLGYGDDRGRSRRRIQSGLYVNHPEGTNDRRLRTGRCGIMGEPHGSHALHTSGDYGRDIPHVMRADHRLRKRVSGMSTIIAAMSGAGRSGILSHGHKYSTIMERSITTGIQFIYAIIFMSARITTTRSNIICVHFIRVTHNNTAAIFQGRYSFITHGRDEVSRERWLVVSG